MTTIAALPPLSEQIAAHVKHGDHLCVICENPRQRLEVAAQYVADGLRNNEVVIYAADPGTTSVLRQMLAIGGIDVEHEIARGALTLPTAVDAYLRDGELHPERVYQEFERTITNALAAGYSGCRFAGEPTWAIDHESLRPGLIEFESRLNGLFRSRKATGLCVYDRSAWPASVVRDVLRTHPIAVVGDLVCERNLYYERPDLLHPEVNPDAQVKWMLAQLRELRTHEARLQVALEAGRLGNWELDLETDRSVRSLRHDRIFGYERPLPDWGYETFMRHVLPEDRAGVDKAFRQTLERGTTWHIECRIRRHGDDAIRWIEAYGRPAPQGSDGGRARHLLGIVADITERKALEQAMRDNDRRKDEFLAMLSHELRNPLAPLTTALQLLSRPALPPDQVRATLEMAQRQTRQLARLVDDLLEVSRITRGQIELRLEPMSVGAAVHAAVESIATIAQQRAQDIDVLLPSKPVRIAADPARIAQILENLLTNASKFTPAGGSIRVEVDERPDAVEIRVVDTGAGIAPEKIPRLFEMFSQLDTTLDRSRGGLGIGLALVKQLVELHGGSVSGHSEGLGKGAAFTVKLPRNRA